MNVLSVILIALASCFAVTILYFERNKVSEYEVFSAVRDERGRFTEKPSRMSVYILANGRHILMDPFYYAVILLYIFGTAFTFAVVFGGA
jgi:hypothetical protein